MSRARKILRIHRSQEEITRIVEGFQGSSLSLTAYAKSENVPQTSLNTWVRKSRLKPGRSTGDTPLIPVHLIDRGVTGSAGLEVVLENGRVIKVPTGFDPDALAQVLQVVDESC